MSEAVHPHMSLLNAYQRSRLRLMIATAAALTIFWWAGDWFHIPYLFRQTGSILANPTAAGSLLIILVALVLSTAIGTFIVGSVRLEAGLFAATFGMAALSMRAAPMGNVLRTAYGEVGPDGSAGIFLKLLAEVTLLYAFVMMCWSAIWALAGQGILKDDQSHDALKLEQGTLTQGITALGAQAMTTLIVMLILCRSDAKAQAMCSVLIASAVGGWAAFTAMPLRTAGWYLAGPLVVAVIGYLVAYRVPTGWQTGHLEGSVAALARALPLDYASFGPAGTLIGYWMARKWHADSVEETGGEDAK